MRSVRARILTGLLIGLIGSNVTAMVMAREVSPQVADIREAASFFANLAKTAPNPIIATMAKDTLSRLQAGRIGQEDPKHARRVSEVSLVPQLDNTYAVPAMVNRKYMATFLVDTGASYTVITPQLAQSLGIDIHRGATTVPVITANGTIEAPLVQLKNVSLGGFTVNNVEAVVTDLGDSPQLSGLLGMSFFQGMELSFRQDKLIISHE